MLPFAGRVVSETSEEPFLFSKLETTDSDELACADEQVIKNLGALQLRYYRVTNIQDSTFEADPHQEVKKIHEKSKKAQVSHQASFGPAVAVDKVSSLESTQIDPDDAPLFQLEFRYRSRQLLQLEGLIPNSPTPSPVPSPVVSPARPSLTPVASASNRPRSTTAAQATPSPAVVDEAEDNRIARLQAELDSLRRQERIAALQREIDSLQSGIDVGRNGAASSSSASASTSALARKVKTEADVIEQRDAKRVKKEAVDASVSRSSNGKEDKNGDVVVLSDSD